ncbi:MAG: ABC transporter permease [Nanoarchaeota archaeon]|nr:ABC transporter permease [Nanoarchaeota archaeon]
MAWTLISEFRAVYGIAIREVKRFFRARSRVFSSIFMPLFWLVIFGTGLGASMKFSNSTFTNYTAFVFPGVIALNLFMRSIGAGVNILVDKQYGFMKEMLVAPISRVSIVVGKVLGNSFTSLIQGCLILMLAILFDISFPLINIPFIIFTMLLISAGFLGLGMMIATFFESVQGFQLMINLFVMPVFMLSGALFPIDNLPSWLSLLTKLDPLTYGVDLLRYLILGVSFFNPVLDVLVVVGFTVFTVIIAALAFNRRN